MHKVDDDRIISTVKKNNLKKSNQAGNTQNISDIIVNVYKHETQRVYNKVQTTGYTQEHEGQMSVF